jgi:hypothetical protein
MTLDESRLYRTALFLSLFTIFYNVLEGIVCIYFGYEDETLTLFGFGVDSFIEVVSGLGIFQMILRIRKHPDTAVSKFEIRALKITGVSFMVLHFHRGHALAGHLEAEGWPETVFERHPCGCRVQPGLHLHVRGTVGFKCIV